MCKGPKSDCKNTFYGYKKLNVITLSEKLNLVFSSWGKQPNLEGMLLIWPSLKSVQIVQIHCISRSRRLKIDFQDENLKIFFSETTRPRA